MRTRSLLNYLRIATPKSSHHGYMLFRSFARTMGVYQVLLTLAFVGLIAVLFNNFLVSFKEVTLTVTDADEELMAMLDIFVNDGLLWLFALVCIYTLCTIALTISGARYLQKQASVPTAPNEQ